MNVAVIFIIAPRCTYVLDFKMQRWTEHMTVGPGQALMSSFQQCPLDHCVPVKMCGRRAKMQQSTAFLGAKGASLKVVDAARI